jgi:hypothetical protein
MAGMFQNIEESLITLRRLQRITGSLAVVLYPEYKDGQAVYGSYGNVPAPFHRRAFQPKPHEFAKWDINERSAPEEILSAMDKHGFTEVIWDDEHAQAERRDSVTGSLLKFDNPHALLAKLLGMGIVAGAHNSVGRVDTLGWNTEKGKRARQARHAFMESPEAAAKTHEGEALAMIQESWNNNPVYQQIVKRVVLEDTPAHAVGTTYKQRRIIENTRQLMAA